jgi:hypothetical protein
MLAAIVSLFVKFLGAHGLTPRRLWRVSVCRKTVAMRMVHNLSMPAGFSPIHLMAGGVDQNRHGPELMKCLIERRANIEATAHSLA